MLGASCLPSSTTRCCWSSLWWLLPFAAFCTRKLARAVWTKTAAFAAASATTPCDNMPWDVFIWAVAAASVALPPPQEACFSTTMAACRTMVSSPLAMWSCTWCLALLVCRALRPDAAGALCGGCYHLRRSAPANLQGPCGPKQLRSLLHQQLHLVTTSIYIYIYVYTYYTILYYIILYYTILYYPICYIICYIILCVILYFMVDYIILYHIILYNIVLYFIMVLFYHNSILYYIILLSHYIVLDYNIIFYFVFYYIVLYSILFYSIILYFIVLYYIILY